MSSQFALRPRAPKPKALGRSIRRPRLDIMDLRAIQTELSAIGMVKVESDEFEGTASDIEEFVSTGAMTLDTLNLVASNSTPGRYVSLAVYIDRDRAFITGNEEDHKVAGVQIKIEQIIRARQRRFAQLCNEVAPILIPGSVGILLLLLAVALQGDRSQGVGLPVLLPAAGLVAVSLAAGAVGKFARGQIMLELRENRPSWFARNRDSLIVQLVVGVVLLGIGYLVGRGAS